MDIFYSIDLAIFYFINYTISTGFLDKFFSIITNVNNWYITFLFFLGILFFKGGRLGKLSALGILILITITDQSSHKLLKEFFERARPCNTLSDVLAPLGCTGSYSFPSNHAVNNFAAATFFARLYPRYTVVLFITASIVALSRVYLGLHYPSDIIAGAAIGFIFGYIFGLLVLKINDVLYRKKTLKESSTPAVDV
ncbi:MAG: phosphatase PAP2 family protein [Ignavibacterium sp.]|nr:MAG: phosphatase PAP2 family protein [Ignavibacterium sp.]